MNSYWLRSCMLSLVAAAALAGCAASSSDVRPTDSSTSSDQSENQKRAHIRLQLAVGYYQQHELKVALGEIDKALRAEPDFADAYSMAGLIYMDMSEPVQAEKNFRHALELSPDNPDFSNNYGWFLCQNGRPHDSIAYFEKAISNHHYDSPAKALNNAGTCSLKLNQRDQALHYFLRAFQSDPSNLTTSLQLARLYYEAHDYQRAHFYINRVVKVENVSADALWLGIRIERKFGDRASEASLATQLSRRYPDSPEYAAYERGALND